MPAGVGSGIVTTDMPAAPLRPASPAPVPPGDGALPALPVPAAPKLEVPAGPPVGKTGLRSILWPASSAEEHAPAHNNPPTTPAMIAVRTLDSEPVAEAWTQVVSVTYDLPAL